MSLACTRARASESKKNRRTRVWKRERGGEAVWGRDRERRRGTEARVSFIYIQNVDGLLRCLCVPRACSACTCSLPFTRRGPFRETETRAVRLIISARCSRRSAASSRNQLARVTAHRRRLFAAIKRTNDKMIGAEPIRDVSSSFIIYARTRAAPICVER